MALHSGIDTVAIVSLGVYSETYGSANTDNVADLFLSFGLLENAPEAAASTLWFSSWTLFCRRRRK